MTRTLNDIHVLTDAELRKAIAEAQGFVVKHGYMDKAGINPIDYWVTPDGWLTTILPNYPASIADAYALEESVPINERSAYMDALSDVIHPAGWRSIQDIDSGERTGWPSSFYMVHATARQKSEAWLAYHEGKEHNNA